MQLGMRQLKPTGTLPGSDVPLVRGTCLGFAFLATHGSFLQAELRLFFNPVCNYEQPRDNGSLARDSTSWLFPRGLLTAS